MGKKKGKRQDDDFADEFKQEDQSTAYVSKQKLAEMEAKEAAIPQDDEDFSMKKKKKSKKNKAEAAEEGEEGKKEEEFAGATVANIDVDVEHDGAAGDIEENFKGVAKKNTRKKKNTEGNLNKEVDLANAFAADDSDEDAPKKKKKHNKKKGKKHDSEDEEEKQEVEKDEEEEADGGASSAVVYCAKCGLPPEYCSFGQKDISACKEWLQKNHEDLFIEVYGEPEEGAEGAEEKKGEEEEKKEEAPKKKKVKFGKGDDGLVKVYRLKRGGRKVLCQITGFEHYTKDLKALAKKFGQKFSCGSNVAQDDIYGECISVQGDVEDRLLDMLETDKDLQKLEVPFDKVIFEDCGNKKGRKQK